MQSDANSAGSFPWAGLFSMVRAFSRYGRHDHDHARCLSSSAGEGFDCSSDFARVSHARAALFLLALSLLAFLPGFFQIPPVDRDEARFAQATKQMVETGDYVDIRFQNEVRYKKPVGIYWMQAGAVKLGEKLGVPEARTTIWLYRIPSLIGALGAVLLTYWAALAFVSRRGALLAGVMMAYLDSARGGSAPRQNRRHAIALHRGGHGRDGADISFRTPPRRGG